MINLSDRVQASNILRALIPLEWLLRLDVNQTAKVFSHPSVNGTSDIYLSTSLFHSVMLKWECPLLYLTIVGLSN